MEMDAKAFNFNVLMLPWLAQGHVSPFLELAKKLSRRKISVYFCSTPVIVNSIKEKISEEENLTIKFLELHLPSLPEIPPKHQTTRDLPRHLISTLIEHFGKSSPSFSKIIMTVNPDFFINDLLQPWADSIASSLNIPTIHYLCSSAAAFLFYSYRGMNKAADFPFPEIFVRDYEETIVLNLIESYRGKNDKKKEQETVNLAKSCNIMLINSFSEIEGKYLDHMSKLIKKKIVPVGPLIQEHPSVCGEEDVDLIDWLDKKDESSCVFISFGSEYFLSKEDTEELAVGLELSQVNFIWVIRFPFGEKFRVEKLLPEGFLGRVDGRGRILEGWAPQARILSHPSVGGFVSHCGWNSVIESMKFGVPIITMPMHLDQPFNARLAVEVGVGVEIVRDGNGKLQRNEVENVLREVISGKIGEDVRKKAKDLSETIIMKEEKEINELVQEVAKLCEKR